MSSKILKIEKHTGNFEELYLSNKRKKDSGKDSKRIASTLTGHDRKLNHTETFDINLKK